MHINLVLNNVPIIPQMNKKKIDQFKNDSKIYKEILV
jgi:hypothetical protein